VSADVQDRLARLVRRLRALQDTELHGPVLARHLAASAPEELSGELDALLRLANGPDHVLAWAALSDHLLAVDGPTYAAREALYRAAREAGHDGVALLLLDPPPLRHAGSWLGDADPELLDRTLGERKWMARKPDRGLIQRLLRVTDPEVTRILLGNPKLTEADVVWLAARRPNAVRVLEEVARSRRWRSLARVRLALVQNPYTPPRIAVLLSPLLTLADLRVIAADNSAHPLLNEMARHLVALRAPAASEEAAEVIPFPGADGAPSAESDE